MLLNFCTFYYTLLQLSQVAAVHASLLLSPPCQRYEKSTVVEMLLLCHVCLRRHAKLCFLLLHIHASPNSKAARHFPARGGPLTSVSCNLSLCPDENHHIQRSSRVCPSSNKSGSVGSCHGARYPTLLSARNLPDTCLVHRQQQCGKRCHTVTCGVS